MMREVLETSGLYSVAEARRQVITMTSLLSGGLPFKVTPSATPSSRGYRPARRVFRVPRGNEGFRIGAWAGDGSVSVMTRQRRRKAERVAAKAARRERAVEIRKEMGWRADEARNAREASLEGQNDAAVRAAERAAESGGIVELPAGYEMKPLKLLSLSSPSGDEGSEGGA